MLSPRGPRREQAQVWGLVWGWARVGLGTELAASTPGPLLINWVTRLLLLPLL